VSFDATSSTVGLALAWRGWTMVAQIGVTVTVVGAVADGEPMVSATEKALINTLET
jgi:hypothetical protein